MADFYARTWHEYTVKLRPSDPVRAFLSGFEITDLIPYFDASEMLFDFRISAPRPRKDQPYIEDTIYYEWWLCEGNYTPIQPLVGDFSTQFYRVYGQGQFYISSNPDMVLSLKNDRVLAGSQQRKAFFRHLSAVDIGLLPKLTHYNILMQFHSERYKARSPILPMGGFTLFDKDKVRYAILAGVGGLIFTAILGVILQACGITSVGR